MGYRASLAILVLGFLACLAWVVYSNTRERELAPLDDIQRQERLWKASAIRDYRIVTYLRQPIAYPQNLTYATTVRNEQIANETCLSGQCNVMLLQHPSTVPDLFSMIRSLSKDSVDGFHASPDQCLTLTFDEQYHFPRRIDFDCPMVIDEEISIQVEQFEILK